LIDSKMSLVAWWKPLSLWRWLWTCAQWGDFYNDCQ